MTDHMRILVVSHMFPNSMNEVYGNFVLNQVKELIKLGHEIKVISPIPWSAKILHPFNKKWSQYAHIPRTEWRDGVEVFYPRYPVFPKKMFYRYIGKLCYWGIKGLAKKIFLEFPFDIIHAHTALPDGFAAIGLKKDFSRPVVLTVHGQDIFSNIKMGKGCQNAVLQALRESDRVVAVSSKLREEMKTYVDPEKMQVIPNGILTDDLDQDYSDLKQEFAGRQVLLSVGYLIKRKGHRYVLNALAQLVKEFPRLLYLIIGDGLEEENLKTVVKELHLEGNVKFLGRKPYKDVLKYMAVCDVFVLPSWDEAFGVVYLEAMSQSKPVIGCRGEGIEDVVTDGINGMLVSSKNSDQLVLILTSLLKHPEKAAAIGQEAKKTVLARFTWAGVAEDLTVLYREVLQWSTWGKGNN